MISKKRGFHTLSIYTQKNVFMMLFLGFSAGLPYLLIFSTLSAWLRDEGIEHAVIGFFSWIGLIYSVKILWSPIVDNIKIPFLTLVLGRRRSWMLLAQLGIMAGLVGIAWIDFSHHLEKIALLAGFIAFCSATQDVTIDAYRIESANPHYQGAMAAMYVLGYRLALLVSGAGAFYIANYFDWHIAYFSMASAMFLGILTTLLLTEPAISPNVVVSEITLKNNFFKQCSNTIIQPFTDFFHRYGKFSFLILILIGVYKISDITMGVMANPFYIDLGFSKKDIAEISKIFGFLMTIVGAGLGGIFVARYGIQKPLLFGAISTAVTNLLFAFLAIHQPDLWLLATVISADNLSGGFATAVFIAYLSGLTNSAHTATQYALFSSLMTFPAQLLGGFSGMIVDYFGYFYFFIYASIIGLPAIFLVFIVIRLNNKTPLF